MAMHNPPHPGEFITEVYLKPNNLSARELAAKLGVHASTLHRILTGASSISPEMALRLSIALDTSPDLWLGLQMQYEKRFDNFKPGDTIKLKEPIFLSSQAEQGNYSGRIKIAEHYGDYGYEMQTKKREILFRIMP